MKNNISKQLKELDKLVKYFEDDSVQLDLDSSIENYKKATLIVKSLKSELREVELTINKIKTESIDE